MQAKNAPAFTSQGVTVYQIYVYMPLFHPVIGLLTPLLKLQTGSSLSLVTKRYNHIDDSSTTPAYMPSDYGFSMPILGSFLHFSVPILGNWLFRELNGN
ncbi:MAG: hypothetical protein J5875_09195 [Paludibacteraceae bacterium]|nr:hypothetical protein [Paludibacteraceae bacterium]